MNAKETKQAQEFNDTPVTPENVDEPVQASFPEPEKEKPKKEGGADAVR